MNTEETKKYREAELDYIDDGKLPEKKRIMVAFIADNKSTEWMTITAEEFWKIQEVLEGRD